MLRKKTKQVRNRNIQLSKMKNNLYVQMTHLSTEVTMIIKSPTKWNTYHIIINNETIGINCHDMVKKKRASLCLSIQELCSRIAKDEFIY